MKKQQSFESAMERLEEIASLMDNGKLSLDDSIKLFSEGAKLVDYCNSNLNQAQLKIEELFPNEVENQNE